MRTECDAHSTHQASQQPGEQYRREAINAAGYYQSPGWDRDYHKMQIRTIDELLEGQSFHVPPSNITFSQAQRVKEQGRGQGKLL